MRPAHREYKFDWMLYSAFDAAARMQSASPKEFGYAMATLPYFRDLLEALRAVGEPGRIFVQLAARYFGNIVSARERGRKTSMMTFCFSPALLYAFDVVPICLEVMSAIMGLTYRCGGAEFLDHCNEIGFTETSCSSQRGALGAYLAGLGAPIDMVVTDTPGVCDTNANAFAFAASYLEVPFFQLDYPPTLTDERATSYHREDFHALVEFLGEHTGRTLDLDRLRLVVQTLHHQDELIAELETYARMAPNPLPVYFTFFAYAARFLFAGMPGCTELLESMLVVAERNASVGRSGLTGGVERARGLFCYIDHYSLSLSFWRMLDELGITHQANILSATWSPAAPVSQQRPDGSYRVSETSTADLDALIDDLASLNSRMPMVKSIRGPYDAPHMWLEDTLALARLHHADFVVYSGTPGCRNTWGMVKPFARDTERAGYPTHIVNADAFDERVQSFAATRERFEEFLSVRRLL